LSFSRTTDRHGRRVERRWPQWPWPTDVWAMGGRRPAGHKAILLMCLAAGRGRAHQTLAGPARRTAGAFRVRSAALARRTRARRAGDPSACRLYVVVQQTRHDYPRRSNGRRSSTACTCSAGSPSRSLPPTGSSRRGAAAADECSDLSRIYSAASGGPIKIAALPCNSVMRSTSSRVSVGTRVSAPTASRLTSTR
jgi:hypothetical protein